MQHSGYCNREVRLTYNQELAVGILFFVSAGSCFKTAILCVTQCWIYLFRNLWTTQKKWKAQGPKQI